MDIRHLRYFVAVVEASSFSRAASELGIAQPTLSRQISALEAEVGAALLVRLPGGVGLTEAGATFVEHARVIVARTGQAIADAASRSKRISGDARIGAPYSLGKTIFADVAEIYSARYPDVTLRFTEGLTHLLLEWLDADRIDLAILTNVRLGQRYRFQRLFSEAVYAIAPIGHDVAKGGERTISLAHLARYPLIISTPMNQGRKRLETDASRQNVKLRVAIESEDPETVKALVHRNLGVAILPYTSILSEIARGSFAALQIENLRHDRYLVQRQDRPPRRAVAELRRIVMATIKRQFRPFTGPNIRLN